MSDSLTVADLGDQHIGMAVLGIPGIQGREAHLLLTSVEHREDGTWLYFRWNDDPSPRNTRRGEFACGQRANPDTPVRVVPVSST